jgi:hypothetical protein
MILMLFSLLYMFDDRWRICCRSQDSARKGPSRHHISEDQENSRKIPENSILLKDSGSQKEKERGARGRPHAQGALKEHFPPN